MHFELKRIAVFPVIKVTFLVSLVLGFIMGLLFALFMAPILALASRMGQMQGQQFGMPEMSIGALIIFLPIVYAILMSVFNTLISLLGAVVYNFIVKFAGGFEFEFQALGGEPAPQPRPADVPGAYYAQASATPRFAPPPPPPPYQAPMAPQPPQPPVDPQGDKNRPTQYPFE